MHLPTSRYVFMYSILLDMTTTEKITEEGLCWIGILDLC